MFFGEPFEQTFRIDFEEDSDIAAASQCQFRLRFWSDGSILKSLKGQQEGPAGTFRISAGPEEADEICQLQPDTWDAYLILPSGGFQRVGKGPAKAKRPSAAIPRQ